MAAKAAHLQARQTAIRRIHLGLWGAMRFKNLPLKCMAFEAGTEAQATLFTGPPHWYVHVMVHCGYIFPYIANSIWECLRIRRRLFLYFSVLLKMSLTRTVSIQGHYWN